MANHDQKGQYDDQYDPFYYNHQSLVHGFDPSHPTFTDYLNGGFMDYNALSRAFDLSCSSASEVISSSIDENPKKPTTAAGDSVGPNSSLSNSSSIEASEAAVTAEEDSAKSNNKEIKDQDAHNNESSNKKE